MRMPRDSSAAGMISSGGHDVRRSVDTCDPLDSMDWSDLTDELDAWRAEGRIATLWWRDDDAAAPAPALDRLAGLAGEHGVTVGLAVIPALAQPSLAPWLEPVRAEVLQHGWAHRSHAAAGEKKSELGRHRAPGVMAAELARGLERLRELVGARCLPVLVPPWNRIDPDLIPALPDAGFRGLSVYGLPHRGGAGAGAQAGELPCRRGGLAGRAGIRRARPGSRRGGPSPRGSAGTVGRCVRGDRAPDPSCGARGGDLDVHRPIPGTDRAASGRPMARAERGDSAVTAVPGVFGENR